MSDPVLLGTPREFTFEGQTYPVSLITGNVQAQYERFLSDRALQRLQRLKATYRKTEYREELRRLGEREDRGEFAFEANGATLQTIWGKSKLLELVMPSCPAEIRAKIMDQALDEVNWLFVRLLKESMPHSAKANEEGDPFGTSEGESPPTATPS